MHIYIYIYIYICIYVCIYMYVCMNVFEERVVASTFTNFLVHKQNIQYIIYISSKKLVKISVSKKFIRDIVSYQYRSSHRRCSHWMFCKKVVPTSFAKLTGKHLCRSLFFNKIVVHRPANLLKNILLHRCFLVSFAKFLRTLFLLNITGGCFCPCYCFN